MRKIGAFILCLIMTVCIFTSCSDNDLKVMYFAVGTTADKFDPAVTTDGVGKLIVRNCFEGLVYTDAQGNVFPAAAENWTISSDGLIYTFTLRSGLKWHMTSNAQEELEDKLPENFDLSVTAYDFEFGLKHALDPATGTSGADRLGAIKGAEAVLKGEADVSTLGIKAVSDTQLVITLSRAQADFATVLSEPMCMPCNETFFNACDGRYGLYIRYTLTNGPFYLSYFDETNYRITKNPDYTGAYPANADVIRLYTVTDDDKLFDNLKAGDYTGAFLSETQYSSFKGSKKLETLSVGNITRSFIMNAKSEALSDVNIRTALVLATDCTNFVNTAQRSPVTSVVPPCISGFSDCEGTAYNAEKAKELFNEALNEAEVSSVTATLYCESQYEVQVKTQLQQWQKIFGTSFIINVEVLTSEKLEKAVSAGNYDIAFYPLSTDTFSSVAFFSRFTTNSSHNIFGISDEELDKALAVQGGVTAASDSSVIDNVYSRIKNASVILPLWSENTYFVYSRDVSGIILLPGIESAYFYNCK